MKHTVTSNKDPEYKISDVEQTEDMALLFRALSVKERIKILQLIQNKPMTIKELARELKLPISSVTQHTNVLQEAQLIYIEYKPNQKGFIKLCSKSLNSLKVIFEDLETGSNSKEYLYETPIGNYFDINVVAPCGMTGIHSPIGEFDNLSSFYHPNRHKAELLWFSSGSVSYRFPLVNKKEVIESIVFSLEICSETLYSRNDWPSDITFWINDVELLTWTSPGDFGGRRGKFTPDYWFINSTQYGLLKTIKINSHGIYLDDVLVNATKNLSSLDLVKNDYISLKIGIKPDAIHNGGINIFGKNFGDHKQSIIFKILTVAK